MAKKLSQKGKVVSKKEDGFDRLARMMKEGFDDVETNLRKEIHASENTLRKEIRDVEERLQYRIAKVSTDIYRHLDISIEPQIQNHERRIKRLEDVSKI